MGDFGNRLGITPINRRSERDASRGDRRLEQIDHLRQKIGIAATPIKGGVEIKIGRSHSHVAGRQRRLHSQNLSVQ
jgi:hypothetical protein